MDAPGLSLFQGNTNININDDEAQKLHEEEALKEQEERNQELGNQLMNAFDDLDELDEDDQTANSSANLISRISENDGDIYGRHNSPVRANGVPNHYEYNGIQTDSDEQDYISHGGKRHQHNEYQLNNPGYMPAHNGYKNGFPFNNIEQIKNHLQMAETEEYGQGDQQRYLEAKYGNIDQLKVLYDVRVREVQNLTTQLEESRVHSEHTISELRKQLLLCQSEKERAIMTRQQTQELLVQTKTDLGNLHNKIDSLNATIKCLEQEKDSMKNEILVSKASLQDSYNRLQIIDRGFGNDKHLEAMLKSTKERHSEEIRNYEITINNMKTRLENYEIEIKQLENRNKELHREQEKLLLEKAETINQLAKKLEDNQKQYQKLLGSKNNSEDFSKQQKQYETLERQNESLKRQLEDATNILESLAQETHTAVAIENFVDSEAETDSMRDMNLIKRPNVPRKLFDHEVSVGDRLFKLQNELRRCIVTQRDRRDEIKQLQVALANKEAQIKSLQDNESTAMFQATHYREEAQKLAQKLMLAQSNLDNVTSTIPSHNELILNLNREKSQLENDLEKSKTENKKLINKINELEQLSQMSRKISAESTPYMNMGNSKSLQSEIDKLKFQLSDAQKEIDRYKTLYIEISGNKDLILKELDELKARDFVKDLLEARDKINRLEKELLEANTSIEKVKSESSHNQMSAHNTCMEHVDVIKRLEAECSRLRDNCSVHTKELVDLNTKLLDAGQEIKEMQMNLDLKKQRDCMIEDLKLKAQQFEEFMYSQSKKFSSTTNSSTSPQTNKTVDKSVLTSPVKIGDDFDDTALRKAHQEELIKSESKIREEMTILFANEIKSLDEKYKSEKMLSEENFGKLMQSLKNSLQIRTKEVEVLKHAILTERVKVKEAMDEKENSEKKRFEEHDKYIRMKFERELEASQQKISTLSAELEERSKLLASERESMAAVIKEWAGELKSLRQKQKDAEKTITHLTEKYSNAKKCVNNYKAYANDKEIHFTKEVERIKNGYEEAMAKVQSRMERIIESGEKKAVERLTKIEKQYLEKIDKLQTENYRTSSGTSIKL